MPPCAPAWWTWPEGARCWLSRPRRRPPTRRACGCSPWNSPAGLPAAEPGRRSRCSTPTWRSGRTTCWRARTPPRGAASGTTRCAAWAAKPGRRAPVPSPGPPPCWWNGASAAPKPSSGSPPTCGCRCRPCSSPPGKGCCAATIRGSGRWRWRRTGVATRTCSRPWVPSSASCRSSATTFQAPPWRSLPRRCRGGSTRSRTGRSGGRPAPAPASPWASRRRWSRGPLRRR